MFLAHPTGKFFLNNDTSFPSCSISHTRAAFIGVKLNLRLKGERSCMVMNYVDSLDKGKATSGHRHKHERKTAWCGWRTRSYLDTQHKFWRLGVLEDHGWPQDPMWVQHELLFLISRQNREWEGRPIVKGVSVCHHQLQNAGAYWLIFLHKRVY